MLRSPHIASGLILLATSAWYAFSPVGGVRHISPADSSGATQASSTVRSDYETASSDSAGPQFVGVSGCAATACHGGTKPDDRREYTIWAARDRHAQAFSVLSRQLGQQFSGVRVGHKVLWMNFKPPDRR